MNTLPTPAQKRAEAIRGLRTDINCIVKRLEFLKQRAVLLNDLGTASVIGRAIKSLGL